MRYHTAKWLDTRGWATAKWRHDRGWATAKWRHTRGDGNGDGNGDAFQPNADSAAINDGTYHYNNKNMAITYTATAGMLQINRTRHGVGQRTCTATAVSNTGVKIGIAN